MGEKELNYKAVRVSMSVMAVVFAVLMCFTIYILVTKKQNNLYLKRSLKLITLSLVFMEVSCGFWIFQSKKTIVNQI